MDFRTNYRLNIAIFGLPTANTLQQLDKGVMNKEELQRTIRKLTGVSVIVDVFEKDNTAMIMFSGGPDTSTIWVEDGYPVKQTDCWNNVRHYHHFDYLMQISYNTEEREYEEGKMLSYVFDKQGRVSSHVNMVEAWDAEFEGEGWVPCKQIFTNRVNDPEGDYADQYPSTVIHELTPRGLLGKRVHDDGFIERFVYAFGPTNELEFSLTRSDCYTRYHRTF